MRALSSGAAWLALGLAECIVPAFMAEVREGKGLRGSLQPKIDSITWEGWTPPKDFARAYASWPDQPVPDDIQVWCKGFIPANVTNTVIGGFPTMPIVGPFNIPIPGLIGQCAATDGRNWSCAPPTTERPTDARFWGKLSVAGGRGDGVVASANCGPSHNICCNPSGCPGGSKYGEVTCERTCDDSEMRVLRVACWPVAHTTRGAWASRGQRCSGGSVAAVKAYIQGRGGNPCGEVLGVKPPAASWDVGVAIFPSKRKVTITGFVDDAPSYECYARAKDHGIWGTPVTLVQVPSETSLNIAIALLGYSDRPVNSDGHIFDLPLAVDGGMPVVT